MTYKPMKFEIDPALCIGCGTCVSICDQDCFVLGEEELTAKFSGVDCVLCGGCETVVQDCPARAIRKE